MTDDGLPAPSAPLDPQRVPPALWPLLERPMTDVAADVAADLRAHEVTLQAAGVASVAGLLRAVTLSALGSGRDYWTNLALGWAEDGALGAAQDVPDLLARLEQDRGLSQAVRHRARRLRKALRDQAGGTAASPGRPRPPGR